MLEFRKGTETFDLLTGGYSFRLKGFDFDTNIRYKKRPYSQGSIQIADRSIKERKFILEGYIIDTSQDGADDLWSSLTQFFRPLIFPTSDDEILLFISSSLYVKVDSVDRIRDSFIRGTERRAGKIQIEVICADPLIYEYEPAYIMRTFGLEGRDSILPEAGYVISYREDGIDGYSVAVEIGTTNLLTLNQASVETDTTDAAANEGFYAGGVTALIGQTYIGSLYIKGATAGTVLEIYLYDADNAQTGSKTEHTLTTDWVRVTCDITLGAAGMTDLRLYAETKVQTSVTWYSDALQIEDQDYATSFAYLTRANGELKFDCMVASNLSEELTIAFQYKPSFAWSAARSRHFIYQYDTEDYIKLYSTAGKVLTLEIKCGTGSLTLTYDFSADGDFVNYEIVHIAFTLNTRTVNLYVNGDLKDTDTHGTKDISFTDELLGIGRTVGGSLFPQGLIDNLVIYPADMSDDIADWYADFDTAFPRTGKCINFWRAQNAASVAVPFTFNNPGQWESHPEISLWAKGTCDDITVINTTDESLQFTLADPSLLTGEKAVIDCQQGTVIRDSTNTIAFFQGAFLKLLPGDNALTYQGAACDIFFEFPATRA